MPVIPADVLRVAVADHVIGEDYRAHARQGGAAMLLVGAQAAAAVLTGFSRVAVRAEDPGALALMTQWAVETAVNKKSWPCLKGGAFHGVALVGALLLDDGIERGALRKRVELGTAEDLPAHGRCALFPLPEVLVGGGHACQLLDGIGLGVVVAAAQDGLLGSGRGGRHKDNKGEQVEQEFHDPRLADWPGGCNALPYLVRGWHQT